MCAFKDSLAGPSDLARYYYTFLCVCSRVDSADFLPAGLPFHNSSCVRGDWFSPYAGGLPGPLYLMTILLNVLTLIDFPDYRYEV